MSEIAQLSKAQETLQKIARAIGAHPADDLATEVRDLVAGMAVGAMPRDNPPTPAEFSVIGGPRGIDAIVFSRVGSGLPQVFPAHLVIDGEGRVFALPGVDAVPIPWGPQLAWVPLRMDQDGFIVPMGWVPLFNLMRGEVGDASLAMQSARMVGAMEREIERLRRVCIAVIPREVILCPNCGAEHIDGENGAEFATRPHHEHLCAACNHIWDAGHWSFGIASEETLARRARERSEAADPGEGA